jgi:dipeptide/tripeptide permease
MSRFFSVVKSYPGVFWAANSMELFERLAYYGIFNLLALYLTNSPETGALGFTQVQKGAIMGIVNAILYFLPVITGAIADRFGYKRVLIIAYLILSSGYYLMGKVSSFSMVFVTFLYVAVGAALFKPIISATIAKTTNEKNSSLGFGIFYTLINIGGLAGPIIASELREISWTYIFLMSSCSILVNLVIVLVFFREPVRSGSGSGSLVNNFRNIFQNMYNVLKDTRLIIFLAIITGAWTVYWQYFYSLPVFIEQWVDTSPLYQLLYSVSPTLVRAIGTEQGIILTEKIIAIDAFFIIIFQVLVSSIVQRFRPLRTMSTGILINSIGLSLTVLTSNPVFIVFSILVFSFGEMTFSPKILEYIGRIAPADKAALYMGTQFLPIAFGNFLGGFLSGGVYTHFADKFAMIRRLIPGLDPSYTLTSDQLFHSACKNLNLDAEGLNRMLWETCHPYRFGLILTGIGCLTFILLFLYNRFILKE